MHSAIKNFENDNVELSIKIAGKAIQKSKKHPEALNLLGGIYLRIQKYSRAIAYLEKAHNKDLDNVKIKLNLGEAYCAQGNYKQGVKIYEEVLNIEPKNKNLLINLGSALVRIGNSTKAKDIFSRVLEMDSCSVSALINLSILENQIGNKVLGEKLARKVLLLEPENGEVYYNLATTKRFTTGDPDIEAMEKLKARNVLGQDSTMYLGYALSKAYEEVGEFDKAFSNLANASQYWRSTIGFDIKDEERLTGRLLEVFSSDLFLQYKDFGAVQDQKIPIFILGMPRSGTTLVEQIISAHTAVFGGGELTLLQDLISPQYAENRGFSFQTKQSLAFPENIKKLSAQNVIQMGKAYLDELPVPSNRFKFVTDKMPGNFRLIGLIRLILPNAKVIHCRRSPLDTCFSCYSIIYLSK
jgi:tetratricopeptide (TPR) repeat protein